MRYVTEESDLSSVDALPWYEIVGLVGDLHANAADPALVSPAMYHLLATGEPGPITLLIRVSGGAPVSFVGRLREIMMAVDPTVRLAAYPLVDVYRQGDVAIRLVAAALALMTLSVLL